MAYTAAALLMVYAPCHVVVAAVASLFLLLSPRAAVGTLLAAAALYGRTYAGGPEHSGARTWPWFQRLCGSTLGAAMCRWFGGITLRVAGGGGVARAEGDPPIVFGYHPHGLYPAAAAWFHHTPAWRAAFPGLSPVTLAASALFWAPLLRDVVMWAGARCVSRGALRRALVEERRSVVLVPGGQAELVEHEGGNTTRLVTRHKGFLRHALEARAAVCPIFVFGEAQEQRHLLRAKKMQRWTAKRLGFPFPFLPGGYLGVLPLPEPRPLTFCVGRPILPAGGDSRPPGAPVTDAEVDALHAAYYAQLVALFEQHKVAAGFPDAKLIVD